MVSIAYSDLKQSLSDPNSDPRTLFEHALELSGAFVRLEHEIGLLPPDAEGLMVRGFEQAGKAGVAEAYLELAMLYETGGTWRSPLLQPSGAEALRLYQLAVGLGLPEASFRYAKHIYFARRTDLAEDAWARAKAFSESAPERADALVLVGYLLETGFGVDEDAVAARRFFEAAAEMGDAAAAFELAVCAFSGIGGPRDRQAGIQWTFRAAELGSDRAQYNLGAYHATGSHGLPRDAEKSLDWYIRAAEAHHPKAAFTAGVMLLTGDGGLSPDPARAAELLSKADYLFAGADVVDEHLDAMGLQRPE